MNDINARLISLLNALESSVGQRKVADAIQLMQEAEAVVTLLEDQCLRCGVNPVGPADATCETCRATMGCT